MSIKNESIDKLLAIIQKAKDEKTYNILDDLKVLKTQYAKIKPREFKTLLWALVDKYETGAAADVYAALLKKCKSGDAAAIKLFYEQKYQNSDSKNEVIIIDNII